MVTRCNIASAMVALLLSCNCGLTVKGDSPGFTAASSDAETRQPAAMPDSAAAPDPVAEPDSKPPIGAKAAWPTFDCDAITAEPVVPRGKKPRGLAALVAGLGIAVGGDLLVSDGVQCSASYAWGVIDPDHADEPSELLFDGVLVRVVGGAGLRHVPVTVDIESREATIPGSGPLEFVLRRGKPSRRVKLVHKNLAPSGPEGAVAKAWLDKEEGVAYQPVGTLQGKFGGGVDKLVVLEPETVLPSNDRDEEPDFCTTEFVVAMAAGTIKGVLPLTRPAGQEPRSLCSCEADNNLSQDGIEVAMVFDLDGDGIEEVAWISQNFGGPLTTNIGVSYFTDGAFAYHSAGSCSYNGCEGFLDEAQCGRSLIKKMPDSRG